MLERQPSVEEEEEEEAHQEEEPPPLDELALGIYEDIDQCFALFDPTDSKTLQPKHLGKAFRGLGIFLTETELEEVEESLKVEGILRNYILQITQPSN